MSENDKLQTSQEAATGQPANPGRRRLGTLGAGGTAVVLSVASQSAMAGWGVCSKSELASGNLSRRDTANPCGCSPGFWWNSNGLAIWDDPLITAFTNFRKTADFDTVFGRNFLNPNKQLKDVGPGTNPANTIGANGNTAMHAVAALLNAAYYGSRYPVVDMQTPAQVIAAFQAAFDTIGSNAVKAAAMAAFVAKVDIYVSNSTWCFGSAHGGV